MFGANYLGESYYAQGPFVETPIVLHTVTASAAATAHLLTKVLINAKVVASVVANAFISKQIRKTLLAPVIVSGVLLTKLVKALDIKHATTKLLTLFTEDRTLDSNRSTVGLNFERTTTDTTT